MCPEHGTAGEPGPVAGVSVYKGHFGCDKKYSRGAYFGDEGEVHRESYAV